MDATSDELTRPVGHDRPAPVRSRTGPRLLTGAACGCGLVAVVAVFYMLLLGDPRGGVPGVEVPITALPSSAEPPAGPREAPTSPGNRADAAATETMSGVAVVRPAGAGAPGAVILRIPDELPPIVAAGVDPALVERTRHGALPRIGPDGARAVDRYARPAGELPGGARPAGRVALVVGGLGISRTATADALAKLPPAVTLAFAPYGADLERTATQARERGHELLLQLPMEPFDYPDSDPGPHTLKVAARPAENLEHLHWALGRLGGYVGVMNYMGGKLTADEKALAPVLREVGGRGLGFLDDGSSGRSLVTALAGDTRAARAEIVVDAVPRADLVDKALAQLEAEARAGAVVVGTASALPVTLDRVRLWAAGLEARGILLVPVSAALAVRPRGGSGR